MDTLYICRARGSVLRGVIVVRRNGLWPRGRNGNMLVADERGRFYVVPGRTLRKVEPALAHQEALQ